MNNRFNRVSFFRISQTFHRFRRQNMKRTKNQSQEVTRPLRLRRKGSSKNRSQNRILAVKSFIKPRPSALKHCFQSRDKESKTRRGCQTKKRFAREGKAEYGSEGQEERGAEVASEEAETARIYAAVLGDQETAEVCLISDTSSYHSFRSDNCDEKVRKSKESISNSFSGSQEAMLTGARPDKYDIKKPIRSERSLIGLDGETEMEYEKKGFVKKTTTTSQSSLKGSQSQEESSATEVISISDYLSRIGIADERLDITS